MGDFLIPLITELDFQIFSRKKAQKFAKKDGRVGDGGMALAVSGWFSG